MAPVHNIAAVLLVVVAVVTNSNVLPGQKSPRVHFVALSMKLFVPFATSDNGVYVSKEKRAEVVPGERAKVTRAFAARKLRQRVAITAR